ncbi:hypothetical protein LNO88_06605 [Klebsiella pneumoniae subsp. pneumoniae]|nr:hypothetical protein [Klebsiella pneumoniae subsp. pneumoniae]
MEESIAFGQRVHGVSAREASEYAPPICWRTLALSRRALPTATRMRSPAASGSGEYRPRAGDEAAGW